MKIRLDRCVESLKAGDSNGQGPFPYDLLFFIIGDPLPIKRIIIIIIKIIIRIMMMITKQGGIIIGMPLGNGGSLEWPTGRSNSIG